MQGEFYALIPFRHIKTCEIPILGYSDTMHYSVLIVDDEDIIREGLKKVVAWEDLGFVIRGTAKNGAQALALLETEKIHVVLTDVRMPKVSGIELSEAVYQRFPDTKVVILSGYDNFNFAQKAIRFGVYHYILKPCREEEIIEVFSRLKTELDGEIRRRDSEEQAMEVLLRYEISQVLRGQGEPPPAGTLMAWIERFTGASAAIFHLWISLDDKSLETLLKDEEPLQALEAALAQKIDPELTDSNSLLAKTGENQYGGILLAPHDKIGSEMMRLFHVLQNQVSHSDRYVLSGAYTLIEPTAGWLQQDHYGNLEGSMERVNRRGMGTLSQADTHIPAGDERPSLPDPGEFVRRVCGKKTDNAGSWEQILAFHRDALKSIPDLSVRQLGEWFESATTALLQTLQSCGIDFNRSVSMSRKVFQLLEPCITVERSFLILKNLLDRALGELRAKQENCLSKSIQDALEIIDRRFMEGLSLEELADNLSLSVSYLSRLFKKETGKNFKEYLLHVRIERAKRMLKESNEKVYIIADSVGYPDQHYFSELFKRTTGFSPLEYRRLNPDD